MGNLEREVSAYLHFGYIPNKSEISLAELLGNGWCQQNKTEDVTLSLMGKTSLIKMGVESLRDAFKNDIELIDARRLQILPLSGGLDSRAILGGLLENMDATSIQTVTFGVPGSWDFEIGKQVAQACGVRNEVIDLSSMKWAWDIAEIVKTIERMKWPITVFDTFVNHQIQNRFGDGCVYWSGFMGDPLAGSHLLETSSVSWEKAKKRFTERGRVVKSLNLNPGGFNAEDFLPDTPFVDQDKLCFDEQLDFGLRQNGYIRHIVLPVGYEIRTPFLRREWVDFIVSLPRKYREREFLYKEILKSAYPKLFSLPTKTNFGYSLFNPQLLNSSLKIYWKVRALGAKFKNTFSMVTYPWINYIDYDQGLRGRSDLKALVHECLRSLKKRGIVDWIDTDSIWDRHQQNQNNHADALILLASLEINMRAGVFNK